jgi:3-hydroxyisobutyrate dehydrogenase-like beta-hydroxyacid dehydrogenase
MSKVAWIGLGVMGYPLAGHLKMRGHHDVVGFNRTRKRADTWVAEFGGTAAPTPAAAARDADFIFTCVGNDDDLREVTLGPDGAFSALAWRRIIGNTTPRRDCPRASRRGQRASRRLPRCPGVRRPNRCGGRHTHGHGRRR